MHRSEYAEKPCAKVFRKSITLRIPETGATEERARDRKERATDDREHCAGADASLGRERPAQRRRTARGELDNVRRTEPRPAESVLPERDTPIARRVADRLPFSVDGKLERDAATIAGDVYRCRGCVIEIIEIDDDVGEAGAADRDHEGGAKTNER